MVEGLPEAGEACGSSDCYSLPPGVGIHDGNLLGDILRDSLGEGVTIEQSQAFYDNTETAREFIVSRGNPPEVVAYYYVVSSQTAAGTVILGRQASDRLSTLEELQAAARGEDP